MTVEYLRVSDWIVLAPILLLFTYLMFAIGAGWFFVDGILALVIPFLFLFYAPIKEEGQVIEFTKNKYFSYDISPAVKEGYVGAKIETASGITEVLAIDEDEYEKVKEFCNKYNGGKMEGIDVTITHRKNEKELSFHVKEIENIK